MKVKQYGDMVAALSKAELAREIMTPRDLKFWSGTAGWRRIEMAWAPFDWINQDAKLAVFGITPGREQMEISLKAYREERIRGATHAAAAIAGKRTGAFSGDVRATLVRILDEVAIPEYLGISTSRSLWGADTKLVHFSSAFRWPVFVETEDKFKQRYLANYTGGTPSVTSQPIFKHVLQSILAPEIMKLTSDCLIAPLGSAATKALSFGCACIPSFDASRLLVGLPHPSGSARDVSSQFLGDPPSATRQKPLNPEYRQEALRLRSHVLRLAMDRNRK